MRHFRKALTSTEAGVASFAVSADSDIFTQSKVKELQKIAMTNNIPIEKLALLYCINNNNIDNVVIGVDSIQQLKRNFNFSTGFLKNDIIDAINQIQITNIELLNPSLWTQK